MSHSAAVLSASEAAQRLGVSAKALRIYEQRGLMTPRRTAAGYRAYGPDEMVRAAEIVSLRSLGLSLTQVARVFEGDSQSLESALTVHEATLEEKIRQLVGSLDQVRGLRAGLVRGHVPATAELARLQNLSNVLTVAFELPWPWGGEWFELHDIRPLNYIIGPLGSGKTRLAMLLAEKLSNALFLGSDRSKDGTAVAARLNADAALKSRVDQTLAWLVDEGAVESEALIALVAGLEADGPAVLVVDRVEQGLDQATQEALMFHLRQRAKAGGCSLFLMTRSAAILDLSAIGPHEALILCPANHSPPRRVAPYPGIPGYEAVATCLASPEVRARIACGPRVA